jgi:hypothetical protein
MLEQVAYPLRDESFPCVKDEHPGLASCGIVIGWKSYAGIRDTIAGDLRVGNRQYPWRKRFPPRPEVFLFVRALRRKGFRSTRPARRQLMCDFRH